jgi:hypothetical protein
MRQAQVAGVRNSGLAWKNYDVLWLHDSRATCLVVKNNILGLGHDSGLVSFMEFEPFHMEAEIATYHSRDRGCYALRRSEWEGNDRYIAPCEGLLNRELSIIRTEF